MVGISADAPDRNLAWTKELRLPMRLLSDHKPAGRIAQAYGAWNGLWGFADRVTYVIDKSGRIRYVEVGSAAADTNHALEAVTQLASSAKK